VASSISIVMTAYKRHKLLEKSLESIKMQTRQPDQIVVVEDGFDNGATFGVCHQARLNGLPVEYYSRKDRPNVNYSNASIPKNIGIKKATGDLLIIQCAEVKYTTPNDIANMARPVEECASASSFAYCQALDNSGDFLQWYAGPERCAGWFLDFCQCVRRDRVMAIGGFDEQYTSYGYEDDCFAFRLQRSGVKYRWAPEVIVQHQWHPYFNEGSEPTLATRAEARYMTMKQAIEEGRSDLIVANRGRSWGILNQ
jgi:GT2 family glycosyltransferase